MTAGSISRRALGELGLRHDVRSLLCEGGPHLARELLAAGLVDELFLSLSPCSPGGEPVGGRGRCGSSPAWSSSRPSGVELLGVHARGV